MNPFSRFPKPNPKPRSHGGLLISGLLVAISFVALVLPLATFHLGQVAAALRTRTAVSVLFSVVGVCLLLGFAFQIQPLILGGLVGLVWSPLLAFSLFARARLYPVGLVAFLFGLPLLLLIGFALSTPSVPDLGAVLRQQVEQALAQGRGLGGMKENEAAQMADTARQGLSQLIATQEFASWSQAAALAPWSRLFWLVFGDGAPLLLVFVFLCFGNVLFLDVAFAQFERLRAVAQYVKGRASQFPSELVGAMPQLDMMRHSSEEGVAMPRASESGRVPEVESHENEKSKVLSPFGLFFCVNLTPKMACGFGGIFFG
jgi:hypothetical protein